MPEPRCLIIRGTQQLSVTNGEPGPITVTVGDRYAATIQPGETHAFEEPVGQELAPGVHLVSLTPYSRAEIWVDPICTDGTHCSTP